MVTILSFSGREDGNSIRVANVIADAIGRENTQIIDFSNVNVEPCNHCHCDCFLPEGKCPVEDDVVSIYEKIMQSEQVFFILANYCGYPNANYFAFNERSSAYFLRNRDLLAKYLAVPKKFVIISNSNQEKFAELAQYQVPNGTTPEMLFLSSGKFKVSSFAGNLMEVPEAWSMVTTFARSTVTKLSEHIYLFNDNHEATGYLVVGKEKALVIDTMNGLANVLQLVRTITDLPVTVINTHGHCDHIFGNIYFEETYVHKDDLALAKEHSSFPEFADMCHRFGMTMPPFHTIEHGEIIDLGGATLEVILTPGHTPGSICLLYREERVLFTGDAINCHLWMQLDNSLKIRELADNLEKLLDLKKHADKILHGHAHSYEDISLLQELYEGARELADHPELSETDPDYHWFGGVAKQHPFGGGNKVICYSLDKLK